MNGLELLENSLALLGTSSTASPEYAPFAVALINVLIAETSEVNNGIRVSKGKERLSQVGEIISLSDVLPCEEELTRSAFVYGLCSKLLLNDDDMARVAYFQNMCASEIEAAAVCVLSPVADVYGGGSE